MNLILKTTKTNKFALIIILCSIIIELVYYAFKKSDVIKTIIKTIFKSLKLNYFLPTYDVNLRYNELDLSTTKYVRELKFEKDLSYIFWLATSYNLIKNKTDVIGAYLIKWLDEGLIKINNHKTSHYIKEGDVIIKLNDGNDIENKSEKELFFLLKKASGNNLIDKMEFSNYLSEHYEELETWFNNLYTYETDKLKETDKILIHKNKYVVSDEILSDVQSLNGFKNYLENFSNMSEKNVSNVKLFNHYLVIAYVLGLNSLIKQELGDLYPEYLIDIKTLIENIAALNKIVK